MEILAGGEGEKKKMKAEQNVIFRGTEVDFRRFRKKKLENEGRRSKVICDQITLKMITTAWL